MATDDRHRTKRLGKYRLIAEIGRGGMSGVYLAVAEGLAGFNKLVVVKEPRGGLTEEADLLGMFLDEARLSARLNHPNIVQTYEVGEDNGQYFIVMEYLDGQPLSRVRTRLRDGNVFPVGTQLRVVADALAGLHYAHELTDHDGTPLGIVHRDVTPQNVFVTYDGHTKLVDFGIAKASTSVNETRTGVLKGKIAYMSPEQARGERVDRRSDIFSMGVILWEAVAGGRLWKGQSDITMLTLLGSGHLPPLPESVNPPEPVVAILRRALAISPADRYRTALEMHDELVGYLGTITAVSSVRAVASAMTAGFEEDRRRIRTTIEEQVRLGDALRTSDSLPIIEAAPTLGTPTGITTPQLQGGSASRAAVTLEPATPPTRSPRALFTGVALGTAIIVVGVAWLVTSEPGAPWQEPVSGGVPAASAAPPPASAPGAATVLLRVEVSPPTARVFLDDALLSEGPYEGPLPRGEKAYRLRVEAEGFEGRVDVISAEADVRRTITLLPRETPPPVAEPRAAGAPKPRAPTPRTPPPATPPSPAPASDFEKKPAGKTQTPIDANNPYRP
jgi:serine/threonine protein kinase